MKSLCKKESCLSSVSILLCVTFIITETPEKQETLVDILYPSSDHIQQTLKLFINQ